MNQKELLWQWASEREEFSCQEAIDATGIPSVATYLHAWKSRGAARVVRREKTGRRGQPIAYWRVSRKFRSAPLTTSAKTA